MQDWLAMPFTWILLLSIRAYQLTLGQILPPACRFEPTCSRYAAEALRRRGLIMGLTLTTWRLLRCQPFCRGGHDPVPDSGWPGPGGTPE